VGGLQGDVPTNVILPAATADAHEFTAFDKLLLEGAVKAERFDPDTSLG
jgi:hypothetical protein